MNVLRFREPFWNQAEPCRVLWKQTQNQKYGFRFWKVLVPPCSGKVALNATLRDQDHIKSMWSAEGIMKNILVDCCGDLGFKKAEFTNICTGHCTLCHHSAWLASQFAGPKPHMEKNLWGIIKRKMRGIRPKNKEQLTASITKTWASITPVAMPQADCLNGTTYRGSDEGTGIPNPNQVLKIYENVAHDSSSWSVWRFYLQTGPGPCPYRQRHQNLDWCTCHHGAWLASQLVGLKDYHPSTEDW